MLGEEQEPQRPGHTGSRGSQKAVETGPAKLVQVEKFKRHLVGLEPLTIEQKVQEGPDFSNAVYGYTSGPGKRCDVSRQKQYSRFSI